MNKPTITLTLRAGQFGADIRSVAVPLSEDLMRQLMRPVELSDEPFSLMFASPGFHGGKGDALTIRRETFKLRRETADLIAKALVDVLVDMFGANDERDGYKVKE
jgi:hypothetical protein